MTSSNLKKYYRNSNYIIIVLIIIKTNNFPGQGDLFSEGFNFKLGPKST